VKTAIQILLTGAPGLPALLYCRHTAYRRDLYKSADPLNEWRYLCSLDHPKSCAWPKERNYG